MSHASSSSSKNRKKVTSSGTGRIAFQSKEGTSDEDESDQYNEEEESSGPNKKSSAKASSSKTKNELVLKKKSTLKITPRTSTAVDSSDESKFDDSMKLSAYRAKLLTIKRRQAILKCVPDAKGMIRKKLAVTYVSVPLLLNTILYSVLNQVFIFSYYNRNRVCQPRSENQHSGTRMIRMSRATMLPIILRRN